MGSAVGDPSGVWNGAPAKIEFKSEKSDIWWEYFSDVHEELYWLNLVQTGYKQVM